MRQSQLFSRTQRQSPSNEPSVNARLLVQGGYCQRLMAGVYSFLPLGLRVITKIESIIRDEMNSLGAAEVLLPALHPKALWEQTGRWNSMDILYRLDADSSTGLALGPTHEEIVTPLMLDHLVSYRDLPVACFQIQTKYRNEPRAKSGLLRGREFRMKDLYSFHLDQDCLDRFYERTLEAYQRVFDRCGVGDRTHVTSASGGSFSEFSHEFQTITEHGEDLIYLCEDCGHGINREIAERFSACPRCGGLKRAEERAIEVGNIFKLGTKFSETFGLTVDSGKDSRSPVVMGCYGIGSTRLMGAIVELLHDDKGIVWPKAVAPFHVHLLSLCRTDRSRQQAEELYGRLIACCEVMFDDRDLSAGVKFKDSDLIGIPLRVVVSERTVMQNIVEVKHREESESRQISVDELIASLVSV